MKFSAIAPIVPLLLVASSLIAQDQAAQSQDSDLHVAGASKVRIVRLSEVKGDVQIDLRNGLDFEKATTNLPIVEKNRLRTGTGVAEVEFEDNSTLRLAPDTAVEFPQLELLPSGDKVSSVRVLKGMVYASTIHAKGNNLTLLFGQQKLWLPPASHIRLQMETDQAKLSVLEGQLPLSDGSTVIPKKKTAILPLDGSGETQVAKSSGQNFDGWDHDAASYHKQFAAMSGLGSSPYSYGVSDLSYYGSFANYGGCGSMWRPHFASAAWDPFANGSWAYYPNAGYSWVSPYPWGWTPYHSGTWAYCDGTGWGWMPGDSWNGLNNAPATLVQTTTTPTRGGTLPHPPIHPPLRGDSSLMAVNSKPLMRSSFQQDSFVFRRDSAGMGVPRGGLGELGWYSHTAMQHGSATTPTFLSMPASQMLQNPGTVASSPRGGFTPSSPSFGHSSGFSSAASPSIGAMSSANTSVSAVSSGGGHPH